MLRIIISLPSNGNSFYFMPFAGLVIPPRARRRSLSSKRGNFIFQMFGQFWDRYFWVIYCVIAILPRRQTRNVAAHPAAICIFYTEWGTCTICLFYLFKVGAYVPDAPWYFVTAHTFHREQIALLYLHQVGNRNRFSTEEVYRHF